jgi:N-acetylneuraminic acid mutarotase
VAVHGGKIYYAGGLYNGAAVNWFDEYDPTTDTWTSLTDMPEARDHFQAAVVGDRFYAIGGRNTAINATTTVNDAYDFGSASWVTGLAPLPTPRGGFAAAAIGTTIFLIGGEGGGRTYPTVEGYDTGTNQWTHYADMPTARHGIEGAVCNGAIYIADGGLKQGGGAPTAIQEAFSPGGGTGC